MKKFSEQFHTKSQAVKLETAERRMLRERVVSYMEYHPLPHTTSVGSLKQIISSGLLHNEGYRTIRIPLPTLLKWSAAVSVFISVVIPVLAEQSVPGDSLYAIKVRFNEEVRSTLTLSPYEKVEWETERLNRRIAEARLLASEGRLTDAVGVEMAAAVREHTESVQYEIEVLRQSDADQATLASIELNTTLEVQSSSLMGEGTTLALTQVVEEEADSSTQMLADVINESLSKQESDIATSSIPAYEKIMARVEINTTRAYELLNSLNLASDEVLKSSIDRRLQDVNRSIERANTVRDNNEEGSSQLLVEVLERTQKLIIFMTDIEVSHSLALESIVPIIPTPEEEQEITKQYLSDIDRKVQTLEAAKVGLSQGLLEKVDVAIKAAVLGKTNIETATNFVAKKQVASDTIALLDDTVALSGAIGDVQPETVSPTDPEVTEATTTQEATEAPTSE